MSENNIQQNKIQESNADANATGISSVVIFKDKPNLVYLYKKTEKLVTAIYLLSTLISDKEPIKWQMRETGLELLSQGLSLNQDGVLNLQKCASLVVKILSFLEISYIAGIISEMNHNIFKNEINIIIQTIESEEKEGRVESLIIPEHFFQVKNDYQGNTLMSKGQDVLSDTQTSPTIPLSHKSEKNKEPSLASNSNRHSNGPSSVGRQDIIINLLKKNTELGIKDFVSSIKGCSEKTIQRELVSLVAKGQIKKEGEKRWSRYSLK